ncbi:MAG TPA: TNT domain-containing protein [Oscillospiraceae bacterium]|nr:TNT domain-containing protein [Oscillospiraceae bacterium]HPK34913.1 TNT domain-containing protein [Oscillospiraceae bacterium]HPR75378.1 TNT domain-containing protein [Oscillospiraceae bacterium]
MSLNRLRKLKEEQDEIKKEREAALAAAQKEAEEKTPPASRKIISDVDYKAAAMNLASQRGEGLQMIKIAQREEWMNKKYQERKDAGEKDVPDPIKPYYNTVKDFKYADYINGWYKYRKDNGEEGVPDYIGVDTSPRYTNAAGEEITEEEYNKENAAIEKYNEVIKGNKDGEINFFDFYTTRKTLLDAGIEVEKGDKIFETALERAYNKTLREIMLSHPELYQSQNDLYKAKFEEQFNKNLDQIYKVFQDSENKKAFREAEKVNQDQYKKEKNEMAAMGLDPLDPDDVEKYYDYLENPPPAKTSKTKEELMEERMQGQDKYLGMEVVDQWVKPTENADYELHYSDNSGIPDKLRVDGSLIEYTAADYEEGGMAVPGYFEFTEATKPGSFDSRELTWDKMGQKTEVDNTLYTQGSATDPMVTKDVVDYAQSVEPLSSGIKVSDSDRNGMSVRMVKSELEDQAQAEFQANMDKFNQEKNDWIKEKMGGTDYESALSGVVSFSHKAEDGKTYTEKDYLAFGGSDLPGYDKYLAEISSKIFHVNSTGHARGKDEIEMVKAAAAKQEEKNAVYQNLLYYLELSAKYYEKNDPTKTATINMSGIDAAYEKAAAAVKSGDHSPAALNRLEITKAYSELGHALNDYNTLNKEDPVKLYQLQSEGESKATFDDRFMTDQEYAEYTYLVGLYGDEEGGLARFYIDSISERLKERANKGNTNVSGRRTYDSEQAEISDLYIKDCEYSADRDAFIAEGKIKYINASKSELKNGDSFDNDVYYTKDVLSDFANKSTDDRREIYDVLDQISALYGNEKAGDTLFYILGKYGFEEASKYSETLNSFYLQVKGTQTAEEYEKANGFKRLGMGVGMGLNNWGKGIVSLVNFLDSDTETLPVIFSDDYAIPILKDELNRSENTSLDMSMGIGQNVPAVVVAVATMGAASLASGAAAAAINVAGRIATTTVFGSSIWGNTYNDMKLSGYSDAEAVRKANWITLSEVGLEMVFDGLGSLGGANSIASKLSKNFGEFVKYSSETTLGRIALTQLGAMASRGAGELLEESTQALIEPFLHYFATGEFNWDSNQGRQAAYDGFISMITGVLLGGATDAYRTFVDIKVLSKIGDNVSNIQNGTDNIIEQGKSSRYEATRALAASVEGAAKTGKLNNIDLGELTSRIGDEIAANLAIEMGEKNSVFKSGFSEAAEYYQALARGETDSAKTVLKNTLDQMAASTNSKTASGSKKPGISEGIKSYFENIRNTLNEMKSDNKTTETVEGTKTVNAIETLTGQKENIANNNAKAEPSMGEVGTQALAGIAETNPGLAENTDLTEAYNAGFNGEDISRDTRDNAAAGNYTDSVEAMYNAGQADAKASLTSSAEVLQGVNPAAETVVTSAAETKSVSSTEQAGTTSTEQSNTEVNPELEAKLAPFEYTEEQRAVAEKYAETGDANVIPDSYGKEMVNKIMQGAEVIKKFNAENGIDTKQSEGYNRTTEDSIISDKDREKLSKWENAPSEELYRKYKSIFDNPKYFDQSTGEIHWPDGNNGFKGIIKRIILKQGLRIDRYGFESGTFVSPEGTPYNMRSLAPGTYLKPYHVYEIIKPIECNGGDIAAWFGEPGEGTQYQFDMTIQELLDNGYIKEVFN